jgi:hypothetical protein
MRACGVEWNNVGRCECEFVFVVFVVFVVLQVSERGCCCRVWPTERV